MLCLDGEAVEGAAAGFEAEVGRGDAAVNDGLRTAHSVRADPGVGAKEGQFFSGIPSGQSPGAGRNDNGVAGRGGADGRIDAGKAAVADQQEVVTCAVADSLDAGETIGALPARRGHLPARLVA